MANLIVEDRGSVRVLTIDCADQMNVLSRPLVAELAQHARQAAVQLDVRAVVITGAGKRAFCAGANLKERQGWSEDDVRQWLIDLHGALREIERCSKPWIAAINGLALGGGGTVRLSRIAGVGVAKDLILTARRVEAVEALQLRIISRISPAGDSVAAAVAVGHEIAENAPLAVAAAKSSIDEAYDLPMDAALEMERRHYEKALLSEDRLEGLKAFAEKRRPRWSGK